MIGTQEGLPHGSRKIIASCGASIRVRRLGMSDPSDAILLARFRAGDDSALDALCSRYEGVLYQFLLGMLRDHHRAEDALQETFVRALEKLDGVDPDHLRGWLFTVAYHQAMLTRRREKSRPADRLAEFLELAGREPDPLAQVGERDDARRLLRLLDQLPPVQREVIHQRVYQGKRFREIADDLKCPLNTALARMHEGLKRLRLLWETGHA
jgi:RNA polymerase sigma-70 factor (ECF subfamily)